MELAGVAADIADARASAGDKSNSRSSSSRPAVAAPLDLFGCVGEGAPADAMAQECLLLWVGVSRAPLGAWVPRDGHGGRRGSEGVHSDNIRRCLKGRLDGPVLKAIFCASDAIRLRLAQSLLQVCSVDAGTSRGGVDGVAKYTTVGQDTAVGQDTTVGRDTTVGQDAAGGKNDDEGVVIVHLDDGRSPDTRFRVREASKDNKEACFEGGEATVVNEIRKHVVRLLLDNVPRPEKTSGGEDCGPKVGEGALSVSGSVLETVPGTGSETGSGIPRARRRDCTQLFDVLCTLVGESMKVSVPFLCRNVE